MFVLFVSGDQGPHERSKGKKKYIFSKNENLSAAHEGLRAAHWS
jgi:hypothetical protein